MLQKDQTVLVVVDIQGKLAQIMVDKERLFDNAARAIKGARVLGLPIVCTEQIPEKLGSTVPELLEPLGEVTRIPKKAFSCAGEPRFIAELEGFNRKQVLLSGIETHICVYQTAMDLLGRGYEVHLLVDAVSSRTPENRQVGLDKMQSLGVQFTSVEMALFELMRVAEGDEFRQIVKIVK